HACPRPARHRPASDGPGPRAADVPLQRSRLPAHRRQRPRRPRDPGVRNADILRLADVMSRRTEIAHRDARVVSRWVPGKARHNLSRYLFPRGSCEAARRRSLRSPSDLRGTNASSRADGDAHDGFHTTCGAAWSSWSPPLKKGPWRTWRSDEVLLKATGIPK